LATDQFKSIHERQSYDGGKYFETSYDLFFTLIGILESQPKDYPIVPVPFTNVKVNDEFWALRLKINKEVTNPIAFRKAEETGRIANIMISGKSYKPDIDRAIELGADSYVLKPFSPKELIKIAIEQMNERASQS
jgi:hypothetical protein